MSLLRRRSPAGPLTCRQTGRILQAYLDGELDELSTKQVAEHLSVCRRCGLELAVYEQIKASLKRSSRGTDDDIAFRRLRLFADQLAGDPHHHDP
jgi:anti-sigma factor RsiW